MIKKNIKITDEFIVNSNFRTKLKRITINNL